MFYQQHVGSVKMLGSKLYECYSVSVVYSYRSGTGCTAWTECLIKELTNWWSFLSNWPFLSTLCAIFTWGRSISKITLLLNMSLWWDHLDLMASYQQDSRTLGTSLCFLLYLQAKSSSVHTKQKLFSITSTHCHPLPPLDFSTLYLFASHKINIQSF